MLVHGLAGAGKTSLAATAPKPLLLLDVEMASRFIRGRKIKWNPLTDAPPVADGTWDICVVSVDTFDKASKAYEYLKSRRHPFKSVVVDSISELQAKAVEKIKGRQQLQTQDWGKLLSQMAFFCRDLRDLTGDDDNIIEAVIITAMSKDYDGILKPYLQGQIAAQVPYWMDITAYMYVTQQADQTTGVITDTRNLLIGNHPNYEAKSRVPGLPPVIENPNIVALLNGIFGEEVEAQAPAPIEAPAPTEAPVPTTAGMPEPPTI
jgi:AAA domain